MNSESAVGRYVAQPYALVLDALRGITWPQIRGAAWFGLGVWAASWAQAGCAAAARMGFKRTTIVVGVKNLLDRDPPFAQWNPGLAAGFDPTYADPRGRMFYTRLSYAFQ